MREFAAEGVGLMERAAHLARSGESFALATVVWRKAPSSGQHGSRAIVMADGTLHGWIGGACAEPVLIREAKRVLAEGRSSLLWLGQEAELREMHVPDGVLTVPISCQSDGALQIFIEPMIAAPHVIIVGRSPMAITLLDLVQALDWRAELIDGPQFQAAMVTPSSAVIVATQGHGDEEALEQAVLGDPAFIGLVASAKRGQVVRGYLIDRGLPQDRLDRVQVPIGIDLGHTTHREMAVSILAELVRRRAEGGLKPTRTLLPVVETPEVTDLVCGMVVAAVAANRPFQYEGTTYYFCAPGCRKAFEKDPASFIYQESAC